jgi:hypothetical protein
LKFIRISSLVGKGLPETFTDPLMGSITLKMLWLKGQSLDRKESKHYHKKSKEWSDNPINKNTDLLVL